MKLLIHRFPFVAVSIAFAVNKEVCQTRESFTLNKGVYPYLVRESWKNDVCFQLEFGVVYSCLEDKMYKARKGKGAFCDDEQIQVSDVKGKMVILYRFDI